MTGRIFAHQTVLGLWSMQKRERDRFVGLVERGKIGMLFPVLHEKEARLP